MGLRGLHPRKVSDAFTQAGYAHRHVCADLDLHQFTRVNTAKGKWAFLDNLLTVKADPSAADSDVSALPGPSPVPMVQMATSKGAVAAGSKEGLMQMPRMEVSELEQLVRTTAAEVIGEELSADGSHFTASGTVEKARMRSPELVPE